MNHNGGRLFANKSDWLSFAGLIAAALALAACGGGGGGGGAATTTQPTVPEPACGSSITSPVDCQYHRQVVLHQYVAGRASPQIKAFAAVGINAPVQQRANQVHLVSGGDTGQKIIDFLAGANLQRTTHYTYTDLGFEPTALRTGTAPLVNAYLARSSQQLFYFPYQVSFFDFLDIEDRPLITDDNHASRGISTRQVADGAWMLMHTGDINYDPFNQIIEQRQAGVAAAIQTGKIHFFYSLADDLQSTGAKSSSCLHTVDYCFGVPRRFAVGEAGAIVNGYPAAFAFATYLTTWERMPANTGISAVFAIAKRCAHDIGATGADEATGLGRLDIGCMAREAAAATSCPAGQILVGKQDCQPLICPDHEIKTGNTCIRKIQCPAGTVLVLAGNSCAPRSWLTQLASHQYLQGVASPIEQAFDLVTGDQQVDRSKTAWLLDGAAAGDLAVDFLARNGLAGDFSLLDLGDDLSAVSPADLVNHYLSLTAGDLVNFSFANVPLRTDDDSTNTGIGTAQLRAGAWVLVGTGNDGNVNPLASMPGWRQQGTRNAAATGKIHFFYDLNNSLTGRSAAANGCMNIKNHCIGAPGQFTVGLRDDSSETVTGKASTFAFAAYLAAWQQMPARAGIGALFDLVTSKCVQDLGATGADDQTGLGRLDIGCLAWEASQIADCPPGEGMVASITCQTLSCPDGQILVAAACVGRKSCRAGTTLAADNNCRPQTNWTALASHAYDKGATSPLQQAFANVTLASATTSRSGQAYLFIGNGVQSELDKFTDLFARMGVATVGIRYIRRDEPARDLSKPGQLPNFQVTVMARDFRSLTNASMAALAYSQYLRLPFSPAGENSPAGIKADGIHPWLLVNTGGDGQVDPLASLPTHYRQGTRQAAATGKVHFFYGLNAALDGRAAAANGCQHIKDHCIGVPWSFTVQLRDDSKQTLSGAVYPATFALAAYLAAWQRMPETTSVAAVFEIARSCVDDIGATGIDDATGLGRLDIGCLAWQAANATDCTANRVLVRKAVCADRLAWPIAATHLYAPGATSPLARAFAGAGIAAAGVDRSADAYVVDTADHGADINRLLSLIGLSADPANPDYNFLSHDDSLSAITGSYLLLSSHDLANYSRVFPFYDIWRPFRPDDRKDVPFPQVAEREIEKGAWLLISAGNDGTSEFGASECPYSSCDGVIEYIDAYIAAFNTNKAHFVYGLDPHNTARRSASSFGCRYVERKCIGVPFAFFLQPQPLDELVDNDAPKSLAGTSLSTPFVFASYLMAWQRMPKNTHISAVFDLAISCVEDLGVPGADADTGLGRLDIGCLAEKTAQVPTCHPGHVLVAAAPARCERFSYQDDMRQFVSLDFGDPITRAFADVDLSAITDRSAAVHVAARADDLDLLDRIGLAAGSNYTRIAPPGSLADLKTAYQAIAANGLVSFPGEDFGDFFTSDSAQAAGLESSAVTSGAHIIIHVDSHADTEGQQNPASDLTAVRAAGVRPIAATDKVHFLYALNSELTGRHRHSDGCQNIENWCLGVPYTYWIAPAATVSIYAPVDISSNEIAEQFGLAVYLQTWERMPAGATVAQLFQLAIDCAQDLGATGADAETGRGRLNIGCMAYETYRLHNPTAVVSTVTIAQSAALPGEEAGSQRSAYMDDFARGLFGAQLGFLSLPGFSDIGLKVGFANDSFDGTYRPVASAAAYQPGSFATRDLAPAGATDFGLRVADDRVGLYYRLDEKLAAGFTLGRSDNFFGGAGSGEFAFDCTIDLGLAISGQAAIGPTDRISLTGGINVRQAGCISGNLLDELRGSEAGLVAGWQRQAGNWQVSASAWASRFVGGTAVVGGAPFAIDGGSTQYGARVQASYSL